MARTRPSRISRGKILGELRLAARKGDRAALSLAVDQMRTLALTPRYWEKYLALLANPLARLVDLLAIKQGERIAHQKGWKSPGGGLRPPSGGRQRASRPARRPASPPEGLRGRSPRSERPVRRSRPGSSDAGDAQPSLFDA